MRGNRRAVPPLKGPSAMCWPSGEGFRVRMRTVSSMKGLSFLSNSTQDSATLRPGLDYRRAYGARFLELLVPLPKTKASSHAHTEAVP